MPPAAPLSHAGNGGDGDSGDGDSGPVALRDCDDELNPDDIDPPAEDFERGDIRVVLKSEDLRSVEGTVIDRQTVSTPSLIELAILIGTGSYLDDGCAVEQDGASVRWSGVACGEGEGTLFNVLTVEPEALEGLSAAVREAMTVRFTGYEVERFNDFSPGGGYWTDGNDDGTRGQVSLFLTDICTL